MKTRRSPQRADIDRRYAYRRRCKLIMRVTEEHLSDSRQNDSILTEIAVEVAYELDTDGLLSAVLVAFC